MSRPSCLSSPPRSPSRSGSPKGINGLMGNDVEGLSSQAMQQGGIGMLLTVVIITMPTVAAALWQGSMGSFMHFSAFSGGGASSPGPQGKRAGSYVPPISGDRAQPSREEVNPGLNAGRTSNTGLNTAPSDVGTRGIANQRNSDRMA